MPSSLLEWPRCEGGRLVKLIYRTSLNSVYRFEEDGALVFIRIIPRCCQAFDWGVKRLLLLDPSGSLTAGLCSHPLQGGIPVPHVQLTLGFTGAPKKIRTSRNRKIRILIPIYVYMGCPLIPCKDRKDKGVFYKLVNYILVKGCLPDFVFLLRTSAIFKQA